MAAIRDLLRDSHTIAVVGLSSKKFRPSHGVAEYMQKEGYRIIPVNPNETEVLGEKSYARIEDFPEAGICGAFSRFGNSNRSRRHLDAGRRGPRGGCSEGPCRGPRRSDGPLHSKRAHAAAAIVFAHASYQPLATASIPNGAWPPRNRPGKRS